jgi:hypothetical protein
MSDKRRLEQLRAHFTQKDRPRKRRSRSEAAKQEAAKRLAHRIETTRKARAALEQAESLLAAGRGDRDLRLLRDELVEELWGLRHARGAFKGKPIPRLQ